MEVYYWASFKDKLISALFVYILNRILFDPMYQQSSNSNQHPVFSSDGEKAILFMKQRAFCCL